MLALCFGTLPQLWLACCLYYSKGFWSNNFSRFVTTRTSSSITILDGKWKIVMVHRKHFSEFYNTCHPKCQSSHEEKGHAYEEHDHAGSVDPHLWLDFKNAAIMVDNLAAAISAKDSANANYYKANASAYKTELQKLDTEFSTGLTNCEKRAFLHGGHYAFGYSQTAIVLYFFGIGSGMLSAAVIAGYTYILWNHPYAIISMTAEVAVVGCRCNGICGISYPDCPGFQATKQHFGDDR